MAKCSLQNELQCIVLIFSGFFFQATGNASTRETYASSSCFIFMNSSLVIVPSPSPSRCSFSREASKSGLGGAGGICKTKQLEVLLSVRVCMQAVFFLCMWLCVYAYMFVHTSHSQSHFVCVCACAHACVCMCGYVFKYVWVTVCVHMHACCVCMNVNF